MIAKPYQHKADTSDRRVQADAAAERRVAFHLQCCFEDHPEVHVLHDLRIEDPEQPQPDGSPGECRFDHLVVHRWGMFVVESKSVGRRRDDPLRRFGRIRVDPLLPGKRDGDAVPDRTGGDPGRIPARLPRTPPRGAGREAALRIPHRREDRGRDRPARVPARTAAAGLRGLGLRDHREDRRPQAARAGVPATRRQGGYDPGQGLPRDRPASQGLPASCASVGAAPMAGGAWRPRTWRAWPGFSRR